MATDKNTDTTPQNDEWTVVSEALSEPETKIVMDDDGDEFTGLYLGMREIPSPSGAYQQARFDVPEVGICFMNANWSLRQGLTKVRVRSEVRIRRTGTQDTGQESPMVIYEVAVKGTPAASARGGVFVPGKTRNT